MYLIPRLIGISTYALILVVFYALLRNSNSRSVKKTINAYLVVLAMIGYYFSPMEGADLSRLIPRMHNYASLNYKQLLESVLLSQTPGEVVYYWIIGQFGNDKLLPCISVLVPFYFCFSMLKDSIGCDNESGKNAACIVFLFMARGLIMTAMSNNRTMLSISFIAWAIYQETVNNKPMWKNIFFYLSAISMHVMGQFIFIIYVAFLIVNGGNSMKEKIRRTVIGFVLAAVLMIVFNNYLTKLIEKALRYIEGARNGTYYSYFWEGLLSAMSIAITVYFLVLIPKIQRELRQIGVDCQDKMSELIKFTWIVVAIDVVCGFIEYSSFMRTAFLLAVFDIPLGMYVLSESKKCGKEILIRNNVTIFAGIMLFIACSRGYLCSLKFF